MFDWRGTLVVDWPDDWWVRRALQSLDRPSDAVDVDRICQALADAREIAPISEMKRTEDYSAEQHRAANLAWFDAAGLDVRLGEVLYNLDFDARCHPFADDVPEVLRALKARDLKIVIVSNIHTDLREDFRAERTTGLEPATLTLARSRKPSVESRLARSRAILSASVPDPGVNFRNLVERPATSQPPPPEHDHASLIYCSKVVSFWRRPSYPRATAVSPADDSRSRAI
jgi:hypothetical protein